MWLNLSLSHAYFLYLYYILLSTFFFPRLRSLQNKQFFIFTHSWLPPTSTLFHLMAKLASLILHSNIFIDYDLKFLFLSGNTEFTVNDYVQKCNFFLVPKSSMPLYTYMNGNFKQHFTAVTLSQKVFLLFLVHKFVSMLSPKELLAAAGFLILLFTFFSWPLVKILNNDMFKTNYVTFT